MQEQQNSSDINLANITENTWNTIHNAKITSENIKNRIDKQHNKISNSILEVISPHKNMYMYI